jgi:OOP family OmpA-OmpF porin
MRFAMRSMLAVFIAIALSAAVYGQDDKEGSKDYPGVTRMPGYYIYDYQENQFDSFSFKVKQGTSSKEQAVEGHRYDYRYNLKDGATMPSALQILRNFQNADKAAGGQVMYAAEDQTTLRIGSGGKEAWINVETSNIPSGMFITMNIIEKQAMTQDVSITADAMAQGLSDTGQVAIYGIYFDTAKSDLKPESDPALAEIAKLMNAHPQLKVYIVGHTDMVGDAAANLKLSQARAQSVVTALVSKNGIAAARLISYGAGPYAPVASNKTDEGRAKNRRVELVEIATK